MAGKKIDCCGWDNFIFNNSLVCNLNVSFSFVETLQKFIYFSVGLGNMLTGWNYTLRQLSARLIPDIQTNFKVPVCGTLVGVCFYLF